MGTERFVVRTTLRSTVDCGRRFQQQRAGVLCHVQLSKENVPGGCGTVLIRFPVVVSKSGVLLFFCFASFSWKFLVFRFRGVFECPLGETPGAKGKRAGIAVSRRSRR